jgi:hypothetical protein
MVQITGDLLKSSQQHPRQPPSTKQTARMFDCRRNQNFAIDSTFDRLLHKSPARKIKFFSCGAVQEFVVF